MAGKNALIVCLANSRKMQGRCISGRELVKGKPGAWIRPVSDRDSKEVSEYERQYKDGSDPKVLDIIRVPLLKHCPKGWQSENWLLDSEKYWAKADRFSKKDLPNLLETAGPLWLNGHQTFHGVNDRIPANLTGTLKSSLKLIRAQVHLKVFVPGKDFGDNKRKVQAHFEYDSQEYAFYVTDPVIEREYLAQKDGQYDLGNCYLTISLGEIYNDFAYKFVAAVIR
jgi:hypothetical protein